MLDEDDSARIFEKVKAIEKLLGDI
jgi:hypothetical protein